MSCTERQEALQDYLAGELSPAEASLIEAHARECASCARDLAAYRALFSALPAIPDPPVPADLHAQVVRAVLPPQPAWRERETPRASTIRRVASTIFVGAFSVSMIAALWGWMGRIGSTVAERISQDALGLLNMGRQTIRIVDVLSDAVQAVEQPLLGWLEAIRRSTQPLSGWGPLLALYLAAGLLGVWLCWRANRQANERGMEHAA